MGLTSIIGGIVGKAIGPVFDVIDQAVTDKDKAAELKHAISMAIVNYESQLLDARSRVIQTEAQGTGIKSWWRPVTMLVFLGLVVSYWFGYQPENLTESTLDHLFNLIKIGLGGYVIGRSGEKIAKIVKTNGGSNV